MPLVMPTTRKRRPDDESIASIGGIDEIEGIDEIDTMDMRNDDADEPAKSRAALPSSGEAPEITFSDGQKEAEGPEAAGFDPDGASASENERQVETTAELDVARTSGGGAILSTESTRRLEMVAERVNGPFSAMYAALEWQMLETIGQNPTLASAAKQGGVPGVDLGLEGASPTVFGITSATSGEGKTTIALHLALAIARNTSLNVCLLDLSLGEDVLCQRLGTRPTGAGAVDVLEGAGNSVRTLRIAADDGLAIIPAGRAPKNAGKAARAPAVPELIAATRQMFDLVIVDMPAVSTGNALPIAVHLDRVLMVVQAGVTPKDLVSTATERIGRRRLAGVVLNRVKSACPPWLEKRFGRAA